MVQPFGDEYFMKKALDEAEKAYSEGEVPVGAVIVTNGKIIARTHNLTETLNDATAHAEMQAITAAANSIGGKYLNDCTLFVTLEPCLMCAAALGWAQMGRVVFGANDDKKGFRKFTDKALHPKTKVQGGILKNECAGLLLKFFNEKR